MSIFNSSLRITSKMTKFEDILQLDLHEMYFGTVNLVHTDTMLLVEAAKRGCLVFRSYLFQILATENNSYHDIFDLRKSGGIFQESNLLS